MIKLKLKSYQFGIKLQVVCSCVSIKQLQNNFLHETTTGVIRKGVIGLRAFFSLKMIGSHKSFVAGRVAEHIFLNNFITQPIVVLWLYTFIRWTFVSRVTKPYVMILDRPTQIQANSFMRPYHTCMFGLSLSKKTNFLTNLTFRCQDVCCSSDPLHLCRQFNVCMIAGQENNVFYLLCRR